jgi:hypothetical protein
MVEQDENETHVMGWEPRESVYDQYEGSWAILSGMNDTNVGHIIEFTEGNMLLMPYQGVMYDGSGTARKELITEGPPLLVGMVPGMSITPISEQSVRNHCFGSNISSQVSSIKLRKELDGLLKPRLEYFEKKGGI